MKRWLAAAAMVGGVVIASASPAFAHVNIEPDSASKGSTAELRFEVPTERSDANTVKVDVKLPTDHPIPTVDVEPTPGWTANVTNTTLAQPITTDDGSITQVASEIVWTADAGGGIKPGEFESFVIRADSLPDDVDSLSFPTVQTYSDGQEVAWIEAMPPGGPEPDHPAPVLQLTAAQGGTGASSDASASSTSPSVSSQAASGQTVTPKDNNGRRLAFLALLVALLGVVLGVVALVRGRREPGRP